MSSSRKLADLLVAPSRIVSKLNWKKQTGQVLAIDVHKDRIGVAVASHPSEHVLTTIEPLHYHFQGGKLPGSVKRRLETIVEQQEDIVGTVVSWPLQTDTGLMGASCGRTLHVVEELMEDTNIFTPARPLAFWDSQHPTQCPEDTWGRCSQYTRTSSKQEHLASLEQYNQDENIVAAHVWEDFVRVHWPNIHSQRARFHAAEIEGDYEVMNSQIGEFEEEIRDMEERFAF